MTFQRYIKLHVVVYGLACWYQLREIVVVVLLLCCLLLNPREVSTCAHCEALVISCRIDRFLRLFIMVWERRSWRTGSFNQLTLRYNNHRLCQSSPQIVIVSRSLERTFLYELSDTHH